MIVITPEGEYRTACHPDDTMVVIRAHTVDELDRLRHVLNTVLELTVDELLVQYPIVRWTHDGRPELEMTRSAWALALGVFADDDRPATASRRPATPRSVDPTIVAALIEPPG